VTNKDDTAPATKADMKAMKGDINTLKEDIKAMKGEHDEKFTTIEEQFQKVLEYIREDGEETRRHFDVTVEQIRHDLEGANKDKIETLDDAKVDHEERITHLEKVVGVGG